MLLFLTHELLLQPLLFRCGLREPLVLVRQYFCVLPGLLCESLGEHLPVELLLLSQLMLVQLVPDPQRVIDEVLRLGPRALPVGPGILQQRLALCQDLSQVAKLRLCLRGLELSRLFLCQRILQRGARLDASHVGLCPRVRHHLGRFGAFGVRGRRLRLQHLGVLGPQPRQGVRALAVRVCAQPRQRPRVPALRGLQRLLQRGARRALSQIL